VNLNNKNALKGITAISLVAITILSMMVFSVTVHAATEEEIELAIEAGMAWLAAQQNFDGSWGTWSQVAKTGFAVLKFETHAIKICMDPLDPEYMYYDQVRNGLDYLFANAYTIDIWVQPAGDPDTDGDGIGVYFVSPGDDPWHRTYETGIAMMAIAASTHPEMAVGALGSAVDGWTYEEVLCDAVDYLAFGQNDAGTGRGGWGYMDNHDWGDNSNTGYAVLGLAYAEAPTIDSKTGFGCMIPDFVKAEHNIWINYIQNDVDGDSQDGGSGYSDPNGWVNILKTGNLLFEMAFVGDTADTPRVMDAVDYIERHWNDMDPDPGWRGFPADPPHKQAIYCMMKGLESLSIDTIVVGGMDVDWFDEISTVLVNAQNADGSWNYDWWGDELLGTEWALLALQKVTRVFEIPVFVDIKPASWPNPLELKAKGVLPVAICGTEDFDVTTIDPETIRLTMEDVGVGVAPLRWSYEDVATPYEGEPCSGHDLAGDGYLDLTLKFKAQEVIATLGLDAFSDRDVIILMLTGNLKEEYNGSPIRGQDCVIILE
jgi:hypothetical protein